MLMIVRKRPNLIRAIGFVFIALIVWDETEFSMTDERLRSRLGPCHNIELKTRS